MAEFGKKDTLIFGGILLVSGVLMKIINDKVETSDWGETYLKARELKLKRLGYLKKAEGETCESCVWRPTYMGTRNYIVACQVCGAEKKLPLRAESFDAESNFDRLANEIAEQYEEKGKSQEEAERIGRATAYKVGVAKYGKEGMAKKAIQGRKQNAETFNAENRDLAGADLRGFYFVDADLSGANLQGADLSFTDILRANLRDANLQGANLFGADLQSADLRGAWLRNADLRSAKLHFADLRGAWLRNADLRGANLPFADLRDAKLSGADFRGAKLSEGQREMIIAGGGILE